MQVVVGILICVLALFGLYFAVKSVVGFDVIGPGDESINPNIRKKTIDVGRDTGLKSYTEGTKLRDTGGTSRSTTPGTGTTKTPTSSKTTATVKYPYSPYYKYVKINTISPAPYPANIGGRFTLSGGSASGINITGWQLKGNRGNVMISRAVADMNIGGTLSQNDIILGPNSYVYAYDWQNPLKTSFRLNKCTGYLNGMYAFSPTLTERCPAIYSNTSELSGFSGACQSYVRSIGTCDLVPAEKKNKYSYDAACRTFLDRVGFSYCYEKHRYDNDFFSNEWRLWMQQEFNFDRQHDTVKLLDSDGLIVDTYTY